MLKNRLCYNIIMIMLVLFMVMGFASSLQELPPVKQGDCLYIKQTCATCTYNNLTLIQFPNNQSSLIGEYAMTKSGMVYNYTFCNTTNLGRYYGDGHGDIDGTNTGWGGFTFLVSGSGQEVTQEQITLLIIGLILMFVVMAFFFILSVMFKHPGTKIFFMAISVLTLVILIGMVASNYVVYLAEFPNIVSIWNSYYIVFVSLTVAAMLGVIIWLIYFALRTFNKSRGRVLDDD